MDGRANLYILSLLLRRLTGLPFQKLRFAPLMAIFPYTKLSLHRQRHRARNPLRQTALIRFKALLHDLLRQRQRVRPRPRLHRADRHQSLFHRRGIAARPEPGLNAAAANGELDAVLPLGDPVEADDVVVHDRVERGGREPALPLRGDVDIEEDVAARKALPQPPVNTADLSRAPERGALRDF